MFSNKSWRTTVAGVCQFLAILMDAIQKLFDGDGSTNPDFNFIAAAAFTLWMALSARDNKVTSEQVKADDKKH